MACSIFTQISLIILIYAKELLQFVPTDTEIYLFVEYLYTSTDRNMARIWLLSAPNADAKNKVDKVVSRLSKFSEKRARQPIPYNPHNPPTKNRTRRMPKIREFAKFVVSRYFFTRSGCCAMNDFHDFVPLPVNGLLRS